MVIVEVCCLTDLAEYKMQCHKNNKMLEKNREFYNDKDV